MRPGADQPRSARLPAHGARARGPGSLGSRHLFPERFAAAAAAATGRRVRANEHAHRGHARGERTGRGARGSTRVQAGSRGHPDTRPLQRPRVAPGHARGPGRRGPAAQPPGAAAAHSPGHRRARPRPPWRPGILHRTGACCRCANRRSADRQTKRQLAGPFTISQRRESLSHVAGHPPQHTHTCPHSHTSPHPPAGPGANPHCCWDPRVHRHTVKVITVLHHQVTWRVPNRHGPCGGRGGLGDAPRPGSRGVGRRGLGLGLAPRPAPAAGPSLLVPGSPPHRASSGTNRSPPPARLVCAARFPGRPAVARRLKLCVRGPGLARGPSFPFCSYQAISVEEWPGTRRGSRGVSGAGSSSPLFASEIRARLGALRALKQNAHPRLSSGPSRETRKLPPPPSISYPSGYSGKQWWWFSR